MGVIINSLVDSDKPLSKKREELISLSSQLFELKLEEFESDENMDIIKALSKEQDTTHKSSGASPLIPPYDKTPIGKEEYSGTDTTSGIIFHPPSRSRPRSHSRTRTRHCSRSRTSTRARSTTTRRRADEVPRERAQFLQYNYLEKVQYFIWEMEMLFHEKIYDHLVREINLIQHRHYFQIRVFVT